MERNPCSQSKWLDKCIPQLTTKGDAAGDKEAEGKEGILRGGVVDQGGMVPDQEDHGMVVVPIRRRGGRGSW